MDIRSAGKIEDASDVEKQMVGQRVKVKIVKNKIAPPFKIAEFDIMYNKGISFEGDLLDLAVKYNVTRKSGAFYSYGETKLGQGRENVKAFLMENDKIMKAIEKDVNTLVFGSAKDVVKLSEKLAGAKEEAKSE